MKKPFLFLFLASLVACDTYDDQKPTIDRLLGIHDAFDYNRTRQEANHTMISVEPGVNGNDFYINNLSTHGLSVRATVNNTGIITIPFQVHGRFEIEGSGSIGCDTVTLTYKIRDTGENTPINFWETNFWIEPCPEHTWMPSPA